MNYDVSFEAGGLGCVDDNKQVEWRVMWYKATFTCIQFAGGVETSMPKCDNCAFNNVHQRTS